MSMNLPAHRECPRDLKRSCDGLTHLEDVFRAFQGLQDLVGGTPEHTNLYFLLRPLVDDLAHAFDRLGEEVSTLMTQTEGGAV